MKQKITNNENETYIFGEEYAKSLAKGSVIGLIGNLGAGKTKFAQGLAKGLGIKRIVNSPTFVIMKVYPIKKEKLKNFVHIDAYRIKNEQDIASIGAEEYFNREDSIVLIEWADKIKKMLPKKSRFLKFTIINNKRKIEY